MKNNIRVLREKAHLSQENLASELGVAQQSVAKWETGKAMPRADKLPELAKILACDVAELFDNDEQENTVR